MSKGLANWANQIRAEDKAARAKYAEEHAAPTQESTADEAKAARKAAITARNTRMAELAKRMDTDPEAKAEFQRLGQESWYGETFIN